MDGWNADFAGALICAAFPPSMAVRAATVPDRRFFSLFPSWIWILVKKLGYSLERAQ
jgi:hypothetical protein